MGRDRTLLVTGASGQVGRALASRTEGTFLHRSDLDVTDRTAVEHSLRDVDVVVHLAAMTNVDLCEAEPDLAMAINSEGTRNIAITAAERGIRMVYVSTDYVFDGNKAAPYAEDDVTGPINVYGRSKLEGEKHVASNSGGVIVRTSWVIGEGHNFIRTILKAADGRDVLTVVDDQRGRPTFAGDLADALLHLAQADLTGIVHVTGDGEPCTWADLAEISLRTTGRETVVERITSAAYAANASRPVAPRPANSVLSLERARNLGVPLAEWRTSLTTYLEEGT